MITDPEKVKDIKNKIIEQEHLERDTKCENRHKAANAKPLKLPKNSERKPKSNYPSRSKPRVPHEKSERRTEYKPGDALSICGFQKDGVSKKKKFGLKHPPESKHKQNEMGDELVLWSQQTQSLQIEDFAILCGISPRRFFLVANYNDYFKECLDIARHNIGSKIFHGVANREIDKSLPSHVYPLYNQQYHDYLQAKEDRKAQASTQVQTVEIPAAQSSELVPDHTTNEET